MRISLFSVHASCLLIITLAFSGCTREKPNPAGDVVGITKVLATIGAEENPNTPVSVMGHAPELPTFQIFFSENGGGVAYISEKSGSSSVVHNGRAGKQYATIGDVAISPDGKRIAYGALVDGTWHIVTDGVEGSGFDAVESPVFSPDSKHVAYQAMKGEKRFIVLDNAMNQGITTNYTRLTFNVDSSLIAYVETAEGKSSGRLLISDTGFKTQSVIDGMCSLMITNAAKSRLAAIVLENGKERVVETPFRLAGEVKKAALYDVVSNPAFGPDGTSLAYEAERAGERFLVFNGIEEKISKRPLVGPPVIRPDLKAVGAIIGNVDPASQHQAISSTGNNAGLHEFFLKDARKGKEYEEAKYLVYKRDGSAYAHAARTGENWFVVINGKEGPAFDMVVTPVFSPDGKRLVYRARKEGKRFVVVADSSGMTIMQHPPYEQVFQPVFTPDGKSVAYGVKDGNRLIWKVEKL